MPQFSPLITTRTKFAFGAGMYCRAMCIDSTVRIRVGSVLAFRKFSVR
jgi:hypothetical protein